MAPLAQHASTKDETEIAKTTITAEVQLRALTAEVMRTFAP
ncbi:MAG: hypothetical protein ACRD6W_15660 [Nitrososphaerales archaeon]